MLAQSEVSLARSKGKLPPKVAAASSSALGHLESSGS